MNQKQILKAIEVERKNQDDKWGEQNHNIFKWLAILGEEVGEANKSALEENSEELVEELIQISAVSVAMLESIYRNSQ